MKQHAPHEWDDDGCCVHCGFDGAEHAHWRANTYEGRAAPEEKRRLPPCRDPRTGTIRTIDVPAPRINSAPAALRALERGELLHATHDPVTGAVEVRSLHDQTTPIYRARSKHFAGRTGAYHFRRLLGAIREAERLAYLAAQVGTSLR